MDSNKSPSLLQCFYDIASPDTDKVYNTIQLLITILHTNQKTFENVSQKIGVIPINTTTSNTSTTTLTSSSNNKSNSAGTNTNTSSSNMYCNDILYTLKRLIKGLNSSSARIGFTLGLIELLINFPGLHTEDVLQQLYTETNMAGMVNNKDNKTNNNNNNKDKGGTSKNEIREAILGRLFGILALYKAGRFQDTTTTTTINSTNTLNDTYAQLLSKIITELFSISNKRVWLHPVSWEIIASLFTVNTTSNDTKTNLFTNMITYNLWQRSIGKVIEAQYQSSKDTSTKPNKSIPPSANNNTKTTVSTLSVNEWSAEHVTLALAIDNAFVHWGAGYKDESSSIVLPEFIRKLRTALTTKAVPTSISSYPFIHAAIDSVTTYPTIHPMWRRLLERCISNNNTVHTEELSIWWPVLIDTTLLHNTKDRRAMAVQIFTLAISVLGQYPAALTILLSSGIIQLFFSELPDKKRLLHGTSKEALNTLMEICRKYPSTAIIVVKAILDQGYCNFDSSTHTQTISTLLTLIQPNEVLSYITYLLMVFHNPGQYIKLTDEDENKKKNDSSMDTTETGVDFSMVDIARNNKNTMDIDPEESSNEEKINIIDRTRLHIVMAFSYALRNPSLTILRDMKIMQPLLSFLAYHAFTNIENNNLPKDITNKLATDLHFGALIEQPSILNTTININISSLLYTAPSIQEHARNEIRNRLSSLIKEMIHVQVSEVRTSNENETNTTNISNRERIIQTTSLSYTLLEIINNVYNKLVDYSSTTPSLIIVPSPNVLNEKGEDDRHMSSDEEDSDNSEHDDDDDNDHNHHSHSSGVSPMAVRKLALSTANALYTISSTLSNFTGQKSIDSTLLSQINDSCRQCSAYSALLGQVSLAILLDNKTVHELATAGMDLLVCSRGLLSSTFATIVEMNTLWGNDNKKNTKKDKSTPQTKSVDTENSKYLQQLTNAVRTIQENVAIAIAETDADNDEEMDNKAQYNRDMAVFIDALLALLANANASLRDAVKTAARPVLTDVTAEALGPIVELLSSDFSGNDNNKTNDDDVEDEDNDENDDDESVTLSVGSDDELSVLLGAPGEKSSTNKKRKRSSRPKQQEESDDEDDDDDESSSEEEDMTIPPEARRAAKLAEMERYDRMLEHMLKLRKEARGNAKETRVRGLHFRFRALDLLDLAVSNLITTSTYSSSSTLLQGYASPEGILLLQLLFSCSTKLASRVRSKESSGHTADADDLNTLLQRVIAIMGRLTKAKVPSMINNSNIVIDSSSIVQIYRDANISQDFLQDFLTEVVKNVHSTRSTALMDIGTNIVGCIFRLLRPVSGSSSTDNNNTNNLVHTQNMQPATNMLNYIVSLYTQHLQSYLHDKHPRISLTFYKNIFSSLPVIAVHCLQTFATSIIDNKISKPFRITEAIQTINTIIKVCTSSVNSGLICEQKENNSNGTTKDKKNKKSTNAASTNIVTTITIKEKLDEYVPLITKAIEIIIQQSIQVHHPNTFTTTISSNESDNIVTLHPKQLREPLELIRLLLKLNLVSTTTSSTNSNNKLFTNIQSLYTATNIDYIKKLCQNILNTAGVALLDDEETTGESNKNIDNDEPIGNTNSHDTTNTTKPSKNKKSKASN